MNWTVRNWFVQDLKGHGHDTDEWRDYNEDNVPFERLEKVYVPDEDFLEQRMNIIQSLESTITTSTKTILRFRFLWAIVDSSCALVNY